MDIEGIVVAGVLAFFAIVAFGTNVMTTIKNGPDRPSISARVSE